MKLIIASFWIAMSTGTPQIAFPFNSQVPEIARVRKPYFFDLSPSTFRTETGPLSFSLSKAPQWLQIDNRNGTLYGLPGDGDAGAPQFIILASDLTGSAPMQATLVVSNEIGPQLHTDIANSLVDIGGRCGLRCLEVSPSTQLQFQFPLDSFTISSSPTFYYATLQDHTPLPAWLQFDRSILQFTGQTPQIGNMAQKLDINLIASDVLGFAAAATSFSIIVSSHRLMFDTLSQIQNISSGQPFSISNLRSHLYLDSALISDTDYAGATVGGPSWLNLDTQSLSLSGIPPNTSTSVNITIDAQDRYGDTAFMTILLNLGYTPLFIGHIGMLNATAGKEFSYQLSKSDFTQNDVVITVNLAQLSNWLHFDPQTLTIQGTIPWNVSSQILDGNITVTNANGSERDFQQFEIDVAGIGQMGNATSTSTSTLRRSTGIIVGVIVAIFILFCTVMLIVYCRFRRHRNNVERRSSVFKRIISRPIPQRTADDNINIGDPNDDPEKAINNTQIPPQPPQVQLKLDRQRSRPKSWRFSGLGMGINDKVSKRRSQAGSKPSLSSLNSTSSIRPQLYSESLQAQYAARLQVAASEYQCYNDREYHHVENTQPISWMSSVQVAPLSYRPASVFAPGRPISGLGHGQGLPSCERHSIYVQNAYQRPSSISEGTSSNSENMTHHSIPTRYHRRSQVPTTPYPLASKLYGNRISTASSRSSGITRPVPRRGPHRSTFFAGGALHRRMNSAAARRFAAVGLGLSTIDGSPGLGAEESDEESSMDPDYFNGEGSNQKTLQKTLTQNSSRYWETTTSGTSAGSVQSECLRRQNNDIRALRPVSDCTWSLPRSDVVDEGVEHCTHPHRTSSIYSRNFEGSFICGSGEQLSSRSHSRSPTKSATSKPPKPTSIMERTRAAYRLTDPERTPLQVLRMNNMIESKRAGKRRKCNAKDMRNLNVGEKAHRPVSVDGGLGIGSLKGQMMDGNEAFI